MLFQSSSEVFRLYIFLKLVFFKKVKCYLNVLYKKSVFRSQVFGKVNLGSKLCAAFTGFALACN